MTILPMWSLASAAESAGAESTESTGLTAHALGHMCQTWQSWI